MCGHRSVSRSHLTSRWCVECSVSVVVRGNDDLYPISSDPCFTSPMPDAEAGAADSTIEADSD
jgi:hypothetical protein